MEAGKENFHLDDSCESEPTMQKLAASSASSLQPLSPFPAMQPLSNLCQPPPPGWEKPISPASINFHLSSASPLSIDDISSPLHGSQSHVKNSDSASVHSPSLPLPSSTLLHGPLLPSDSSKLEKPEPPSTSSISTTVPSDTVSQSTFLSHESLHRFENLMSCSTPLPSLLSEPPPLQVELSLPEGESPPLVCENHKSPSTSSLGSSLLPTVPPPHVSSHLKESPPPGWENSNSPSILLHSPSHETPFHGLPSSCSPLQDSAPPGWEKSKPEDLPHGLPPSCSPLQDSAPPGWENSKPEDLPPSPASMPQPLPPNPQALTYCIPDAEMGQLVCGSCHALISYPRSSALVQCPCCQTVNYVLEEHQVGNVECGNCSVLLMYPYGAPSVRCSSCHFVTRIRHHNKRPPLSVQQGRHLEPRNCA